MIVELSESRETGRRGVVLGVEMIQRWRREMTAGGIGALGSAGAMVYADLPEGPSLGPLLAAVAVMSAVVGVFAGARMASGEGRRMIAGLIAGEIVGIMAIVLVSMRPLDSLEQVMGGLSLAGSYMAAPAALISLVVGWVSVGLGSLLLSREQRRARR